jgi:hypothetical protein
MDCSGLVSSCQRFAAHRFSLIVFSFSSPKIAPEDFTAAYEWRVDRSCGIFDASMMASFDVVQYVKPCAVATLCKLEQ